MTKMRAIVIDGFGGPEVLVEKDMPMVTPGIGEAVIQVHAAGINPIDAKTRAGKGVSALIREFPAILGVDFCGTIVQPAFDTHRFQPGDEVFGMVSVPRLSGSYAQFLTVPVTAIARKPRTLSHISAAAVPCAALTAWGCIVSVGAVKPGDRVLIHAAAGGVGHFAVQLAKRAGAYVVATASARNAEWLMELGVDEVIDYRATRFEDAFREDAAAAGVRATDIKALSDTSTLTSIAELIDTGDLRVHVDREFPLVEAAEAHRVLELGHTRGKIVLTVPSSP
jgi:NADPH:quinone reductase-like Zn-dependent oxidoreductase